MEKYDLPRYSLIDEHASSRSHRGRRRRKFVRLTILLFIGFALYNYWERKSDHASLATGGQYLSTEKLQTDYDICATLRHVPKDPSGHRERNARYVDGHNPVLIRNATVWTAKPYYWMTADVFMEHGLIKRVGPHVPLAELPADFDIYDAHGRVLTSGIVDMHSHSTVDPLPGLRGWSDDNELSNDITPYVRSLDGINPLDHQLQVIKSGGVTTSLILPGSGNNMGGEAFVIKHAVGKTDGRPEISAEDMLADPDKNWRHMKFACGENPQQVYGKVGRGFGPFSRLGEAWYFRHAFEQASALVTAQNDWCEAADRLGAENMASYLPQDLEWESLGALLRGQVLLNTHCYTVPDLEAFVRHTNEFKFKIQAFHHAHQTYLVPEILKRAYGGRPPAAALFADNMYYKAEAYVASEQAGKILYENGITPVYVSDNPVLNAQHVVFEAAKAYKNGLPYDVALAGVTSAPAELLGLGERIGKVKPGFDADIVVWDSHPLAVGAAPVQVWIDGTPQFDDPVVLDKTFAGSSSVPEEQLEVVGDITSEHENLVFLGVSKILIPGFEYSFATSSGSNVVVRNGSIICAGSCEQEVNAVGTVDMNTVKLSNGHLAPPATAFGSSLGLVEIDAEEDTQDGDNSEDTFSRAVDGLALDTKSLKAAYSHGVTKAITPPSYKHGGYKGISAGFLTGALHAAEKGVVWEHEAAVHYSLVKSEKVPSLSGAVGQLKAKLLKSINSSETKAFCEEQYLKRVVSGELPLVITVHSADLIVSLLRVKADIEGAIQEIGSEGSGTIRLIISGGAESYMLADELAAANVGVVLAPFLAYAETWDQRRSLTGAPLTNGTAIDVLHAAGVKVAIGTSEDWQTRNLYLSAGIAYTNGGGKINATEAIAFVTINIYDMLGLDSKRSRAPDEFVVFDGSPLEIDGRVRAVADGRGKVTLWS